MKTAKRRFRASRIQNAPAEVQELESRQLLTGTVTASLSADDDLTLIGDSANNNVLIRVSPAGNLSITGRNGTSVKFGNTTTPAGTPVVIPVTDLRDLTASFGDGADVMEVRLRSAATVTARNVDINTGAGNDLLILNDDNDDIGPGGLALSGTMRVWTEGGNDRVRFDIYNGLDIAGSLGVLAGQGNDRISIQDREKFVITQDTTNGVQAELEAVPNDTATAGNQIINVQYDINLFTEDGADSVLLLGVEAGRDILVEMEDSGKDIFLANNVRAGQNFGIRNADAHSLNNIYVVGFFGIRSGSGNDRVVIDHMWVGRNVDIYLGGGDDQLAFGGNVHVAGSVLADGGSGYDRRSSASAFANVQYKNFEAGGANEETLTDFVITWFLNRGMFD